MEDFQPLKPLEIFETSTRPPVFDTEQLGKLFDNLFSFWKPVLISLSLTEPTLSIQLLENVTTSEENYAGSFFVNSVEARLETDTDSAGVIANSISAVGSQFDKEIVIAYFYRRLVSTLEKSWKGKNKISLSYSDKKTENIDSLNYQIRLNIEFDKQKNAKIDFFVSEHTIELLCNELESLNAKQNERCNELNSEIMRFSISPEKLIEYLKPGNIINTEEKFFNNCVIYSNSQVWAKAKVKIYNSKYVLEIEEDLYPQNEKSNQDTVVSIELEKFNLYGDLNAYNKTGLLLPTNINTNSNFFLSLRGEKIATVALSIEEGEDLKIKVLSKL